MKKVLLMLLAGTAVLVQSGCTSSKSNAGVEELDQEQIAVFTSSDKNLESVYVWAKKMALSYAHDGQDSVGYWYEAALPQREAFCMRDVSHQSVGAQLLGLAKHNKNMFRRFAENISESKDWCTYWEINRYNKPAPADYANDEEFWYNLNANFDVIQACWKMFEWTGDKDYLTDSCFTGFYDKSLNEYVERWRLEPENVMDRPRYMNQPENFDPNNNFHTCRGLASYVENFRGLTMGVDLLASMYGGFQAHASMADFLGNKEEAKGNRQKALQYRNVMEKQWWSEDSAYYQTFWTEDRKFYRGEGVPFILWFGATENQERIRATVADMLKREWNVENLSAFPMILYRLGYYQQAYDFLVSLPKMNRSEYPEVSYGVVEGIISGGMGIEASASRNAITTCSRLSEDTKEAKVENVPVFGGYVTVKHTGRSESEILNHTGKDVMWNVAFVGDGTSVQINGKTYPVVRTQDNNGNTIVTACVELPAGETLKAKVIKSVN